MVSIEEVYDSIGMRVKEKMGKEGEEEERERERDYQVCKLDTMKLLFC